MFEQTQLHSLLPATTGEHVTLAPQPLDDCDRLTTDERGVYIVPPRRNLTVVIERREAERLEARADEHPEGSYKHEFFSGYAAMHRARLADLSAPDEHEPANSPEPSEEWARVGITTQQLSLQD